MQRSMGLLDWAAVALLALALAVVVEPDARRLWRRVSAAAGPVRSPIRGLSGLAWVETGLLVALLVAFWCDALAVAALLGMVTFGVLGYDVLRVSAQRDAARRELARREREDDEWTT